MNESRFAGLHRVTRGIRTTAACACLVLLLGLLLLFGRSYSYRDTVQGPHFVVFSWRGQLAFGASDYRWNTKFHAASWPRRSLQQFPNGQLAAFGNRAAWPPVPSLIGFSWTLIPGEYRITFPHWAPIVLLALATVALKPSPRFRVGLREVFVLTTMLCLALGSVAAFLGGSHRTY